jgi:hypothetical protein
MTKQNPEQEKENQLCYCILKWGMGVDFMMNTHAGMEKQPNDAQLEKCLENNCMQEGIRL